MDGNQAISVEGKREQLRIAVLVSGTHNDFELCVQTLEGAQLNFNATQVTTCDEFLRSLETAQYDIILSNYRLADDWTGLDAFEVAQARGADLPFILVTGPLGEERALECMRAGITDIILKTNLSALPWSVTRALEDKKTREDRKRTEAALRKSERTFRVLADSISSAVFIYEGTRCVYVNRAAETLTGYSENELLSLNSWNLVHPDSRALAIERSLARLKEGLASSYDIKVLTKQGEVRWWEVKAGSLEVEGHPAGLITATDITDRKLADLGLDQSATRDALTGLFDIATLRATFDAEVKRSERTGRSFACFLLKVAGVKELNDQAGLPEGSRALCKLANVIGRICRGADVACRYAEDEFVVVLPETPMAGTRQFGLRIEESLKNDTDGWPIGVSIGAACFPQAGSTLQHLVRSAGRTLKRLDLTREFARSA